MLNTTTLEGRLGLDAQIKGAGRVTRLRMAVTRSWRDPQLDAWQESTFWINVVAFGFLAERNATLKKGQRLVVSGELRDDSYTNGDGVNVSGIQLVAASIIDLPLPRLTLFAAEHAKAPAKAPVRRSRAKATA